MPVPAPQGSHLVRCLGVAFAKVGYSDNGDCKTRPSFSSTFRVSAVTETDLILLAEKFIPAFHQCCVVFIQNALDLASLSWVEIIRMSPFTRRQPYFSRCVSLVHMDMRRFRAFVCVEEEPEAMNSQNRWHRRRVKAAPMRRQSPCKGTLHLESWGFQTVVSTGRERYPCSRRE